jgi:hypothetical protein
MNPQNKRIVAVTRLLTLIDFRYSFFLAVISSLCSIAIPAFSQPNAKNAIYLEAASKGPLYSLNCDRIIRQGEILTYSLRAGFSVEKNALSFPVGFNFITGRYDHHMEFGFTIIPYFDYYEDDPAIDYTDKSDKYLYVNPAIGYRFQKPERSFFFKAAMGPSIFLDPPSNDFWDMDPKLDFFGSVSAGISF